MHTALTQIGVVSRGATVQCNAPILYLNHHPSRILHLSPSLTNHKGGLNIFITHLVVDPLVRFFGQSLHCFVMCHELKVEADELMACVARGIEQVQGEVEGRIAAMAAPLSLTLALAHSLSRHTPSARQPLP